MAATPAAAWDFATTGGGTPLRWFARDEPLPFKLGAVPPEEMPIEVVTAVVEIAWSTWRGAGCEGVASAVYRGATDATEPTRPKSLSDPPDNLVLFARTAGAWSDLGRGTSEIAVTFVSNNERTGEIVDADIVVNDARWRFVVGGGAAVAEGEVDFASAMTHEVGHALGLLHSADPTATMFASYTGVEPAGARTLADDDREGLCAAYAGVPEHVSGTLLEGCASGRSGWAGVGLAGLGLVVLLARRRRG